MVARLEMLTVPTTLLQFFCDKTQVPVTSTVPFQPLYCTICSVWPKLTTYLIFRTTYHMILYEKTL